MHIESPETFRLWLASALAPLSDANPESLAKYVHALVKKDKPIEELKDLMVDQLDVFLLGETKTFVQLIFKNLESKEYLSFKKDASIKDDKNEEPTSSIEPTAVTAQPAEAVKDVKDVEPTISSTEEKTAAAAQVQNSVVADSTIKEDAAKGDKKDDKKKETERDERFRLNRSRLKRDGRSRSRSWDRQRRSRSRERPELRDRDRDRRGPGYRNKSPRRYERRRSFTSRSPSPGRYRAGSRSKSRSPKFARNRFRNRSPGHSRSRSRSRDSPRSNRSYDAVLKEELLAAGAGRSMGGLPGRRCRDYELKGYCMRGDLCPYDHNDPVVVSDLGMQPPMPYGVLGPIPPAGVPPPGLMPPSGPPPPIPSPAMMLRPPPNMEYSPDAPSMNSNMTWCRPPYQQHGPRHPMHPMGGYHPHSRDLINVHVGPNGQFQDGRHLDKRSGFDRNTNCCLDIKKIPPGLNNITHLNNHFAKFGKIINIQVSYNNDPESAMITFSSPAEASAAFKSTEAVLNNRFIKVFWHYDGKEGSRNVKDRLGPHSNSNNENTANNENVAVNTATCLIKKSTTHNTHKPEKPLSAEDQKAKLLAQLKSNQELLEKNKILRKKSENNRKEAIELKTELRKRSQNLLEKHIEEQKELLKKLQSGNLDEKQRNAFKEAIKALQETIEKVKSELIIPAVTAKLSLPVKKTKEQLQKEILDMELDIISKTQEGVDLVPFYKKLGALKSELHKLQQSSMPIPVRPIVTSTTLVKHPMHGYNNHLRKNNTKLVYKAAVDHRPTKLLISGYESDEKDQVLSHFREYGEIADYISDDSTPSMVLNYKTRQEAEMAINRGKNFQDRVLSVTWFATPHMPTRRRNSSTSGPSYHMHAGRQVMLSPSGQEESTVPSSLIHDPCMDPGSPNYSYLYPASESPAEVYRPKSPSSPSYNLEPLESSEELLLHDDDDDGEEDKEERSWRR